MAPKCAIQTPTTTPDTAKASGSNTGSIIRLMPYGYQRVGTGGGSRPPKAPPRRYYWREATPHPNPLQRHLPRPPPPPRQPAPTNLAPGPAAPANLGPAPAAPQQLAPPSQQPQPRQQKQQYQGRVVMTSNVPMYYYNARNYAAHAALMASATQTMFPVAPAPPAPPAPPANQPMYKPDIEAAKIITAMSRDVWAEERRRNEENDS